MVGAHLTLFHHLPGEQEERVRADLEALAPRAAIPATVRSVRLLGQGVAYDVDAPPLVALRAELAERWASWLTRQDRGWGRPHVTVQNKVSAEAARALHAELERGFEPWPTHVEALALWHYAGGPWEPVDRLALRPSRATSSDDVTRP